MFCLVALHFPYLKYPYFNACLRIGILATDSVHCEHPPVFRLQATMHPSYTQCLPLFFSQQLVIHILQKPEKLELFNLLRILICIWCALVESNLCVSPSSSSFIRSYHTYIFPPTSCIPLYPLRPLCCQYEHGCRAIYWSVNSLSGVACLKKSLFLLQQLLIANNCSTMDDTI